MSPNAYETAVTQAKPLVIVFHSDSCHWCVLLRDTILPTSEINAFADGGVFALIDATRDDEGKNVSGMIKRLGITKYPSVVALDVTRTEIVERGRIVAYHDLPEFRRQFERIMPPAR